MSVTDFGYGSNNKDCNRSTDLNSNKVCPNNNWLFHDSALQWTITPKSDDNRVWIIHSNGVVTRYSTRSSYSICPSMYLKPEVKIISGEGTKEEPFCLFM